MTLLTATAPPLFDFGARCLVAIAHRLAELFGEGRGKVPLSPVELRFLKLKRLRLVAVGEPLVLCGSLAAVEVCRSCQRDREVLQVKIFRHTIRFDAPLRVFIFRKLFCRRLVRTYWVAHYVVFEQQNNVAVIGASVSSDDRENLRRGSVTLSTWSSADDVHSLYASG